MKPYRKLIAVDDNAAILTALRFALEDVFEHIDVRTSPDDIISLMQEEPVDLIILDMNFALGANTGHEGIFWLRAIKRRHPEVPVVLLTAYANVGLAVRALKAGAADFVVKPWDNDELVTTVRKALEHQREIKTLDAVEAEHIRRALDRFDGNLTRVSEALGISRQTLYNKIKKMEETQR